MTAAIAITVIVISSVYRDECPAEPKLTTWCLTFGLVLAGLFVLNALLKLTGFAQTSCQANGICLYIIAILLSTFILMLLLFAFGWLITGNSNNTPQPVRITLSITRYFASLTGMVWTYSIRSRLTFTDRRLNVTHCDPQFYFFLFWGMAALMLFLLVSLAFKLFNYMFKFCSELSSDDCAFF